MLLEIIDIDVIRSECQVYYSAFTAEDLLIIPERGYKVAQRDRAFYERVR